jgi:peroxiredoxin
LETAPVTLSRGKIAFLVALMAIGVGFLGLTLVRYLGRRPPADLAQEARDYLQRHKEPLSGPLEQLLREAEKSRVRTHAHPLLGLPAPDFELPDHQGRTCKLGDMLKRGPVVVVFYYGYYCNHCVSQLFDLNEDIRYFRELGAEVVAISPDSPELTRERYKQYGEFAFAVLSDPQNKVAEAYGVYSPATAGKEAVLLHGTFVLTRDGLVEWAHSGTEPFTGNRTLLYQLARVEGRLPKAEGN